ncbi:hypothetical protein AX17_000283 [Amanita inopinata Kibby_2008]|nr:hypothetical protein AX17_000283 [Amanita inopinata Kibby_2008]
MKKSWHPLLLKNQERVWLEEKKALEEKKKLEQLRKEKEEERQLQDLQRLQEEQTGKKRTEKLEWMYATPATGTNQNPNDLEDYLLGKKRVDKILTADDNAKLGAAHKNFIAVQNANNVRDITAKIREDPLLAIKQQEQAAYQALMSNPLRLRELQERNGIKPKKDKKERRKEREERRSSKHSRRADRDKDSRSHSPEERYRSRYRDPSPDNKSRRGHRSRSPDLPRRYNDDRYDQYSSRQTRRSRSPPPQHRHYRRANSPELVYGHTTSRSRLDESDNASLHRRRVGSRSQSRRHDKRMRSSSSSRDRGDDRIKRVHTYTPPPQTRQNDSRESPRSKPPAPEGRAARLAAMTSNATTMTVERQERLTTLLAKEKAELEAEERVRSRSKGMSSFLSQEQKKVFGGMGGLEDRIKRGRAGLVVDAD